MKSYILLRNNKESGPFTLQELKEYGLTYSDLVWIEGESTSWSHPSEIRGLKTLTSQGIKKAVPGCSKDTTPLLTPSEASQSQVWEPESSYGTDDSDRSSSSLSGKPYDFYHKGMMSKSRNACISTNFFGFGVLLTGLMFCAVVVKKMIDHFDYQPSPTAQAVEIKAETLPLSISSHTAKAVSITSNETVAATAVFHTDSMQPKPIAVKKTALKALNGIDKPLIAAATTENKAENAIKTTIENGATDVKETTEDTKEEEKETAPIVRQKPSLQLAANEYKVGMFGGISNLELSVSNPSSQNIEKAIVEVEFLKPNGNVVNSQTMTVENISPGSSKKIAVPSSSRGVKVRYHIVRVDTSGS
jgi:hypothetical protein